MKKKLITIILTVLIFFFANITPVLAQPTLPITVLPARNEVEVTPGEKQTLTITFYNQSDEPISGFFKTADFIVDDNQGTPRLIENPEDAPTKYSAAKWIKTLYDKATLPAHEKVNLQIEINTPKDAHPGGRYVAVFFEVSNNLNKKTDIEDKTSATALRIASLIYIKVKGPITEKALIARFFAPSFLEYGPIKITTDILNRGDYHINPKGLITLTNMFKGITDQQLLKPKNIFPDTSRTFTNELGKKWMFGRYRIDLTASYGETGQVLTASTYVWVFPWRVAVVVILTLMILYLLANHFYKNFIQKEKSLEEQLKKEQEEIEKLKKQLQKGQ